jgi:hypothetical protein
MRYRSAGILTLMLLAAACKPTAPAAEPTPATPAAAAVPEAAPAAAPTVVSAFTKQMPYADLRKHLIDAGWLPLRDPMCWENVGGEARVCESLPEVESCSGDGHCVMHFANADEGKRIRVTAYGPSDRWNVAGEEAAFAVTSWDVSALESAAKLLEGAAPACPSRDFDSFLKAFASDTGVERAFTAPVVTVNEIEDRGDAGYFSRKVYVSGTAYRDFNIVYSQNAFHFSDSAGKQDPKPLPLEIASPSSGVRDVRYRYGSSEGNSYRFQERGGCWYLTEDPEAPADP